VLPFRGDSMSELMYKIANEEAPDIRIIRPELPQQLADVIALSLSKRPETRYQTGDQFAVDMRSVISQMSGVALASTPKPAGVEWAVADWQGRGFWIDSAWEPVGSAAKQC